MTPKFHHKEQEGVDSFHGYISVPGWVGKLCKACSALVGLHCYSAITKLFKMVKMNTKIAGKTWVLLC